MDADEAYEARRRLRRLRFPLRSIFWGGLLVVLYLNLELRTAGGGAVRVDVLNDTLGFFLVAIGVVLVASLRVWSGAYEVMISLVAGVAVAAFLGSVAEWWFPWKSAVPPILSTCLWYVGVVAVILFSVALAWLAKVLEMPTVAGAWRRTAWLSMACYGGALVVEAALRPLALEDPLGMPWLISLFVVFAARVVPLVSLFLATGLMMKAADAPWSGSQVVRDVV